MRADTLARILLAIQAATLGVVGAWAGIAPQHFYDRFPGFGRYWISIDGPYNEHLLRDFGSLNLAIACLSVAAAVLLTPTIVRVAAAVTLVFALPHLSYHIAHLSDYETVDQIGNMVSLGLAAGGPVVVYLLASRFPPTDRATA